MTDAERLDFLERNYDDLEFLYGTCADGSMGMTLLVQATPPLEGQPTLRRAIDAAISSAESDKA